MRETVTTPDAPASTSPVALGTKGGRLVFVSGQMPRDPATGLIPPDGAAQARLSMQHCLAVLAAAGSGPDKVMMAWVYVTDLAVKSAVNAVFRETFGDTPVARNLVAVSDIGDAALVEISLIALA
ncbi:MAG: RidA family protein [Rhodobacter sp.]|jgi:2-iminobutanoate/2-iminopropanoate deaminase|nr:RidA family protein [Rhodobacter sp.]